ncbi:MAG: NifB/NifX family molybdenum-iron cluster-binding protein [Elusimicrobia bacterium]|nr:NifB/NifX family molybdenum-iron cluster-binding protein [Elusimicrobiota bacterium]
MSKICITSQGNTLDSQVDPRFGRCQYFIIVDPATEEFEVIENSNINAMGGAGIQSAQIIANKGVKTVLTGNVGPNAFSTLSMSGIKVITGISGTIKEAIELFKKGSLEETKGSTVPGHYGTASGNDIPSRMGKSGGGRGGGMPARQGRSGGGRGGGAGGGRKRS